MGADLADFAAAARRSAVALMAMVALSLLPALAHASPPDPVWLQGVYDDDDSDDVVLRALSTSADIPAVPDHHEIAIPLFGLVSLSDEQAIVARPIGPARSRAPPAS